MNLKQAEAYREDAKELRSLPPGQRRQILKDLVRAREAISQLEAHLTLFHFDTDKWWCPRAIERIRHKLFALEDRFLSDMLWVLKKDRVLAKTIEDEEEKLRLERVKQAKDWHEVIENGHRHLHNR